MPTFVEPQVHFIGATKLDRKGVEGYLKASGNEDFIDSMLEAEGQGIDGAEIMCSMLAKLCYKSLSIGHNANVNRTRDIKENIEHCFETGHNSVFRHASFNFIVSGSRVFTHELVRHGIGTAFSQNSGRYIRIEEIEYVADPILADCALEQMTILDNIEQTVYVIECKKGLRIPNPLHPNATMHDYLVDGKDYKWIPNKAFPMDKKKQLTSAIRRIAPDGRNNEIGVSFNITAVRHMMMQRTSRYAEWEIRFVFDKIYRILKEKYKMLFYGAKEFVCPDGLIEVSDMTMQPYDRPTKQQVLKSLTNEELLKLVEERKIDLPRPYPAVA